MRAENLSEEDVRRIIREEREERRLEDARKHHALTERFAVSGRLVDAASSMESRLRHEREQGDASNPLVEELLSMIDEARRPRLFKNDPPKRSDVGAHMRAAAAAAVQSVDIPGVGGPSPAADAGHHH